RSKRAAHGLRSGLRCTAVPRFPAIYPRSSVTSRPPSAVPHTTKLAGRAIRAEPAHAIDARGCELVARGGRAARVSRAHRLVGHAWGAAEGASDDGDAVRVASAPLMEVYAVSVVVTHPARRRRAARCAGSSWAHEPQCDRRPHVCSAALLAGA